MRCCASVRGSRICVSPHRRASSVNITFACKSPEHIVRFMAELTAGRSSPGLKRVLKHLPHVRGNCATVFSNQPGGICGCSLFLGDICGGSFGAHPSAPMFPPRTHFSSRPPSLDAAVLQRDVFFVCLFFLKPAIVSLQKTDQGFHLCVFILPKLCFTSLLLGVKIEGNDSVVERSKASCGIPPTTLHHQSHPQHPRWRENERKQREGGRGHVIRRACGHSFTPRQNERGPAVSLLHD